MTCIIVDDETPAQNVLKDYVHNISFLDLIGVCDNAIDAMEIIINKSVDIVFIDIEMPLITGIEAVKSLQNKPYIIFTTAHTNYAFEGFELNAIDYLHKPISFERFLRSVNKVRNLYLKDKPLVQPQPLENISKPVNDSQNCIYVKENGKFIRLDFEEIISISGFDDYIKIFTNEKMILTHLTMKKIEELLPSDMFVRVHRSNIIRISQIKSINGNMIEMKNKSQIQIGSVYRDQVLSILKIIN